MKETVLILLSVTLLWLTSCQEKPKPVVPHSDAQLKESLERVNRYVANDEEEDIENYVRRHQWNMVSTGTGMR